MSDASAEQSDSAPRYDFDGIDLDSGSVQMDVGRHTYGVKSASRAEIGVTSRIATPGSRPGQRSKRASESPSKS